MNIFRRLLSKSSYRSRDGSKLGNNKPNKRFLDISKPHTWFEDARKLSRTVTCHVGPTNSGKTYHALQVLANASSGMYCAPLRLLAWEVHELLKYRGVKCSLTTGNEKEIEPDDTHLSCTVEMVNLSRTVDVAVLDEAQLIGHKERGWAWTQAFLGLKCHNIHLCGSSSMLPIIRTLCEDTNDTLIVKEYERLSPLDVASTALISYDQISQGDCVIAFSRKSLYEIKRAIERKSKSACSIIYGNLPPVTRKDQAKLFSDPNSDFNCLVATDAIGMGLNLPIKRIIFSSMEKYDGVKRRLLMASEVKQIAGRAGRFRSSHEVGEVTCLHHDEIAYLHRCMNQKDSDVHKAGLFPSIDQLELLALIRHYRLTDEMMASFWTYHDERSWTEGFTTTSSSRKGLNGIGSIICRFTSVSAFAQELLAFLSRHPEFSSQLKKTEFTWSPRSNLTTLLEIFAATADVRGSEHFFICNIEETLAQARIVDGIPLLSLQDKYQFCTAPTHVENEECVKAFRHFAVEYALGNSVNLDIELPVYPPRNVMQLLDLETKHNIIDLYIWLCWRFSSHFVDLKRAQELSLECSRLISEGLTKLDLSGKKRRKYRELSKDHRVLMSKTQPPTTSIHEIDD